VTGEDREDSGHDNTQRRPLGLVLLGGLYLFFLSLYNLKYNDKNCTVATLCNSANILQTAFGMHYELCR